MLIWKCEQKNIHSYLQSKKWRWKYGPSVIFTVWASYSYCWVINFGKDIIPTFVTIAQEDRPLLGVFWRPYPEFCKYSNFPYIWPLGVPNCCFYHYFSGRYIFPWIWRHYSGKKGNSNFRRKQRFSIFGLFTSFHGVTRPFLDGFSKTKYLWILWNEF